MSAETNIDTRIHTGLNEIDFRDVFGAIRREFMAAFITGLICVLLAIIYLQVVEHKYTVSMQVISTESQGSGVSGGLASLAGIAGVNLSSNSGSSEFDLYKQSLTSINLAKILIHDDEFMKALFPDLWDVQKKDWIKSDGIVQIIGKVVKPILGMNRTWEAPPEVMLQKFLINMVSIKEDRDSPVITISLLYKEPELGKKVLSKLHKTADGSIRLKELNRTKAYIDYLKKQLDSVHISDYRRVLIDLLREQEQRRMLAKTTLSYSAEIFSDPSSSAAPTSPKPILVVFLSIFLGLIFGTIVAMIRDQVKRKI